MQQIVNVTIDESGRSIADSKSIGLQYETGVARFVIAPDPSWVSDQYFYYLIVSPPEDSDKKQYAVPLVNQGGTFVFKISSGITWNVGNYKFAFISMSKELTDGIVPTDGIVSISTAWNCKIEKSILDYAELQKQPADENFQLLYTDLMALSVELKNAINNIDLEGNYAREQGDEAKKQAEYAEEQGNYAKEKGDYANTKAELANTKAEYANTQGNYAKTQGEQAQTKGNKAQVQGNTAEQQGQYATEQGNYAKRVGDTVQGQIDRLRANQVQGTASGKEIVVADAAEIESNLHISGNSEQDSRSGKNIAVNTLTKGYTTTMNGITYTVNDDYSIKVSGTAEADSTLNFNKDYSFTAGEYVISGGTSDVPFGALKSGVVSYASFGNPSKFTISEDIAGFVLRLKVSAGVTVDTTVYPQIEKGTVATDYEPYGVQPSPDYPSEIRSVKSKSDNMLRYPYNYPTQGSTVTSNGLTITDNSDGSIKINGTTTSDTWINLRNSEDKLTLPKGTYTLSGLENLYSAGTYPWSINCSGFGFYETFHDKKTFTLAEETSSFMQLKLLSGFTFNNVTIKPMLNKGSEALPYQPYGYVPVELKAEGKNKFNKEDIETGYYINDSGSTVYEADSFTSGFIEVPNGNCIASTAGSLIRIGIYDSNKTFIRRIIETNTGKLPITINSNEKYVRISAYIADINTIQLEYGTVSTPYEPYKLTTISLPLGDIVLRSTPDGTRDTFERVDGVWNKVGKIGSAVFDGSDDENWLGTNDFYTNKLKLLVREIPAESEFFGLSNYFKVSGYNYRKDNNLYFHPNKNLQISNVSTQYYPTIQDWKNWLNNNPTEVIYPLNTPTYTPITDTALISALDQLEQLILHKGYNYITATSVNGVKAQLDLSYYKDINAVLNNIMAMVATIGGELNV